MLKQDTVTRSRERDNPLSAASLGERLSQSAGEMPVLPERQCRGPPMSNSYGERDLGSAMDMAHQELSNIVSFIGRPPVPISASALSQARQGPTQRVGGGAMMPKCPFCVSEHPPLSFREDSRAHYLRWTCHEFDYLTNRESDYRSHHQSRHGCKDDACYLIPVAASVGEDWVQLAMEDLGDVCVEDAGDPEKHLDHTKVDRKHTA